MARTEVRLTPDQYFMEIARTVARRSTCDRKSVGAVLATLEKPFEILATGFNGSIAGEPHCDEVGHLFLAVTLRADDPSSPWQGKNPMAMVDSCQRVVHAEANAIAQAAGRGVRVRGGQIYVTASPCWSCFKLLANAGIRRIIYGEAFYRDVDLIQEVAARRGIELIKLTEDGTCT